MQSLRPLCLVRRNGQLRGLATLVAEFIHGHAEHIDDAAARRTFVQRILDDGDGTTEALLGLRKRPLVVRLFAVDPVDDDHHRRPELLGVPPDELRSHFHTVRTVQHQQARIRCS